MFWQIPTNLVILSCVCVCGGGGGGGEDAGPLFCGVVLGIISSLAIILLRKRAGCFTKNNCVVAVYVLYLFLIVLWVGL